MADRTKLDFNFISLVLSVSGRVRPVDLQSIPEAARANALQAFYQANAASMPLHFDGDALVRGTGSAAAAAAAPATAPAVAGPAEPGFGPAPGVAAPEYADAAAPMAAVPSDYSSVSPAPAGPAVHDPFAEPFAQPAAAPAPATAESDFFAIPPEPAGRAVGAGQEHAEFPGLEAPSAQKVSFLWWLLPVFFTLLGGLIAFFLVRKRNAKRAKALLITGIVLTLLYAVLGAAAVFGLGMLATSSLQKSGQPSTPEVVAVPAAPPMSTEYPQWKIVEDRGIKTTQSPSSSDPNGKVRQDHAYVIESPDGKVRVLVWYARSAPDMTAVSSKPWSNLDTVFKGMSVTNPQVTALATQFAKAHPSQLMLGAYAWTKKTAEPTFWVGWGPKDKTAPQTHGEYAYAVKGSTWHIIATSEKSGDYWASTGAVK